MDQLTHVTHLCIIVQKISLLGLFATATVTATAATLNNLDNAYMSMSPKQDKDCLNIFPQTGVLFYLHAAIKLCFKIKLYYRAYIN